MKNQFMRGSREYNQEKLARIKEKMQPRQDIMQVCLAGHKITQKFTESPETRRKFCQCGQPTTTTCGKCNASIIGEVHYPGVIGGSKDMEVPRTCHNCGAAYPWADEAKAFLESSVGDADISKLTLNADLKEVIQQRLDEAFICLNNNAPLAAIILCGSAVEGMLSAYANNNQQAYNQAASAPKTKDKTSGKAKVKPLGEWHLVDLINVAKEVGHINEDAKKYSDSLREFRNYVHPTKQIQEAHKPDIHSATMAYHTTKLIITRLGEVK